MPNSVGKHDLLRLYEILAIKDTNVRSLCLHGDINRSGIHGIHSGWLSRFSHLGALAAIPRG